MDEPPAYEDSVKVGTKPLDEFVVDTKTTTHLSIREEVGASRTQNVAALVARLLPHVRSRARQGLSRTALLLLPSDQDGSHRGQLVGFPDDELPSMIQLDGHQDTVEFWTQQQALQELQQQMFAAISIGMPQRKEHFRGSLPPSSAGKSSFFRRRSSKSAQVTTAGEVTTPPVTVIIQAEEVYFRSENEYGLSETSRRQGVLALITVR